MGVENGDLGCNVGCGGGFVSSGENVTVECFEGGVGMFGDFVDDLSGSDVSNKFVNVVENDNRIVNNEL